MLKNKFRLTYPDLHETFRAKKTPRWALLQRVFYGLVHPNGQFPNPELRLATQLDHLDRGGGLYATEPPLQLVLREFLQ